MRQASGATPVRVTDPVRVPASVRAEPVEALCGASTGSARTGLVVAVVAAVLLTACAPGREFVRKGQQMIDQGRVEEGLSQIDKGLALEPGNAEYRMLAIRQREVQIGS